MSHHIKTVIVVGASGTLGAPILNALVANGSFTVSALTREESKATFPSSVKVHRTDYSPASLEAAFKGQDAVVSAVASTALADQAQLINAAAKVGVKRFLPSEFGANTSDPKFVQLLPILQPKIEILKLLKQKEKDGLSWTAVVNGSFYDWGLNTGFLGINLKEHTATLFEHGTTSLRATTLNSVGRGVAAVLAHPEATANKFIYIESFHATQQQILKAVEKATGKTFKVDNESAAKLRQIGDEKVAKGDWSGVVQQLQGTVVSGLDKPEPSNNKLIGLPTEDLDEVTAKVLSGQYS